MAVREQTIDDQRSVRLSNCIDNHLKPFVKKIDTEAYYARDYLLSLGKLGLLKYDKREYSTMLWNEVQLVEATSSQCMTTGFSLWCHLAAITYMRNSQNPYLHQTIRSMLEKGIQLGATGLSNPMKYYAGLETLHLQATRQDKGYLVQGTLPMVSNLAAGHWFGFVAEVQGKNQRIMGAIDCSSSDIKMQEKLGYLGLNGSATYSCKFDQIWIPDEWVISEDADQFIPQIRPVFTLYQIPLGLGVVQSAIDSIRQCVNKQNACNQFLPVQADELEAELFELREQTYKLCQLSNPEAHTKQFLEVRLATVYLALKATQADMLHHGGAAYFQYSAPSRRLREIYFFANLTPTVKHLEKILQQ